MSIRYRTLLATMLTTLAAVLVFQTWARLILARGFEQLEQVSVVDAVARVQRAIESDCEQLSKTTEDWATWDDSYQFIQDRNSRYISSNLTQAPETLELAGMFLFDRQGRLVYGGAPGGQVTMQYRYLPPRQDLQQIFAMLKTRDLVHGLLETPGGLVLVGARPILKSEGIGPAKGTFLMIRAMGSKEVADIGDRTLNQASLISMNQPKLPHEVRAMTHTIAASPDNVAVKPVNNDKVTGYAMMPDALERPLVMVRVDRARNVWRLGRRVMDAFSIALLLMGIGLGLVINWVLQKLVVSRIATLTRTLREVAARGDSSARVKVQGNDEVATLAMTLNNMMAALEASEEAIRQDEARLRVILNSVQTGIVIIDAETHQVIEVNEVVPHLCGRTREEFVGAQCKEVVCSVPGEGCFARDSSELPVRCECLLPTKDGQGISIIRHATVVTLNGRQCILESFLDITERKRAEQAIYYQAHHDTLTGLPNRLAFHTALAKTLARAQEHSEQAAVLLLDLDRFKVANDTLGHMAGDNILQLVSSRLQQCVRGDDLVARLGGDEFAMLLPTLRDRRDADAVATRVLEALRQPVEVDGFEIHPTTSIGISIFPHDGTTVSTLIQNADVALYQAKDQGRDTFYHYAPWINATAREQLSLENDLRKALSNSELVLYYQPQVYAATGRIVGMEALVRWRHPQMGLLLPGEFLPVAQEARLMESLDEWVLREACRQVALWRQMGLSVPRVAVNISPSQVCRCQFSELVKEVLAVHQLAPGQIELEITEHAVITNVTEAKHVMPLLRQAGVRLCMDDFGIGSTSLAHLKEFPLDTVKIDSTFLSMADRNPVDAAIVAAVVAIGESRGLLVIGEGVETEAHVQFLLHQGCHIMQGFLFSTPVPVEEATTLLQQGVISQWTLPYSAIAVQPVLAQSDARIAMEELLTR